ncbi:MAG: hypothetical protein K6E40_06300 [Desulfovibrio sp.]|nr:hypothetical protein [Desulfovibrio sp.]
MNSYGVFVSPSVGAGGAKVVAKSGMDYGASVAGSQGVLTGGAACNAEVLSGDVQNVSGLAQGTLVRSGGRLNALAGGSALDGESKADGLLAVCSCGKKAVDLSVAGRVWLPSGASSRDRTASPAPLVSG